MSLPLYAVLSLLVLLLGYRFYGRFIARRYQLDDRTTTPALRVNDGIDFVPTKKFYLLGQHFSAIAAAGPIAGPILACQQFGWLPCLLWILVGVVLIGAVHDFSSLITSVRHNAQSVAEIVKQNIGRGGWIAMLVFIWLMLVYVITAFTDITAATFIGRIEELEGVPVAFERGGAVAAASLFYLILALLMGLLQRRFNPPLWLMTAIFVPATLAVVWLGTVVSHSFLLPHKGWVIGILIYCFIASLLPVWSLLQPRGYLGGFILYMALAVGLVGIFFGGYEIHQGMFKTWQAPGLAGSLFPFLFVTIACGACSGFHGLVCSGTTSKQISKESDCRLVGYGGMLMEGFVAVIALATIMIVRQEEVAGLSPGAIYGAGIGKFLTLVIGKENLIFAITFGAMAFSTFVFDTLDVATRLARYILQELFGSRSLQSGLIATLLTVLTPGFFILSAPSGSWSIFWVLFGTSNQLLAALILLTITVWLKRQGRPAWFTQYPMLFVMTITFWSLVRQIGHGISVWQTGEIQTTAVINMAAAIVFLALALFLAERSWGVAKRTPS